MATSEGFLEGMLAPKSAAADLPPLKLQELADRLVPDLPSGPLDTYRKKASFDWKKLKVAFYGQDNIKFENTLWGRMMDDPIFHHVKKNLSLDGIRRLTFLRFHRLIAVTEDILPLHKMARDSELVCAMSRCVGMYDMSLYVKFILSNVVFQFALMTSGQDFHAEIAVRYADDRLVGCLALTELGHGSNLKKLQTEAVYDHKTQEFVIHSPTLESTKCWSGNLGHHATHTMLFAQLYTEDGALHGLHSFVIPVRDPKTQLPYPGVVIGDMGAKAGLNGIDNGFMRFDHYRVPRESLMNTHSDVTPDGKFVSAIKNGNTRFGATLGNLSAARCGIGVMCTVVLAKGLVIAVRYSAVRRQFGPSADGEEVPVWEYELQRWRLIPYISVVYVLDVFSKFLTEVFMQFSIHSLIEGSSTQKKVLMAEIHCLSCANKAIAGWLARDGLQECREACGGHGYLKMAGLGDLRNDHDASLTYEGDNNVLVQQTSHYLLLQLQAKRSGERVESPMRSCDFINDIDDILELTWSISNLNDVLNVEALLSTYKWLICYLLRESEKALTAELAKGVDRFTAVGNCQVYRLHTLALAYFEHVSLQRFHEYVHSPGLPENIRVVLGRLCLLFGLWSLEKRFVLLYEGGHVSGCRPSQMVRQAILQLCSELKDDAVSLVDVLAPPDEILNSALGVADGQVYKSIYGELVHRPGALEVPEWWKDVQAMFSPGNVDSLRSRL